MITGIGLAAISSGGASIANNRCCTICMLNNNPAIVSMGESRKEQLALIPANKRASATTQPDEVVGRALVRDDAGAASRWYRVRP